MPRLPWRSTNELSRRPTAVTRVTCSTSICCARTWAPSPSGCAKRLRARRRALQGARGRAQGAADPDRGTAGAAQRAVEADRRAEGQRRGRDRGDGRSRRDSGRAQALRGAAGEHPDATHAIAARRAEPAARSGAGRAGRPRTTSRCAAGATPRSFDFAVQDHVDLGAPLGLDFDTGGEALGRALRVHAGARSRGCTARSRSSCSTCRRSEHGYTECYTPYIVNARHAASAPASCRSSRQDLFAVQKGGAGGRTAEALYLIPTSEVSLTNIVRDEIVLEATSCRSSSPRTRRASARRPAATARTRAA